jgi:hypothetical protein
MKKRTLLILSFFTVLIVTAQDIVSTQGDSYSNSSGSIDFTIGEVVINSGSNITQGFHQTNWSVTSVEEHIYSYQATIFPNPTSEILNIKTSTFDNVSYRLYDAKGKLVMQDKLSAEETLVQVSQLVPGPYSLILSNVAQNLKTFTLIKIH